MHAPVGDDDDLWAWFTGEKEVPQAGEPGAPGAPGAPAGGGTPPGWTDFDFEIPADSTTVPEGWEIFELDGLTPDEIWNGIVTGADLGFGSGAGTFYGTFETTALNGVAVENFLVAPNSLIDVIIDASGGGIQGTAYFVDSAILLDVIPAGPCCPADLDGDGSVGFADLIALLEAWGPCPGCDADIDESGVVGLEDLLTVLAGWGACE